MLFESLPQIRGITNVKTVIACFRPNPLAFQMASRKNSGHGMISDPVGTEEGMKRSEELFIKHFGKQ
jgi:hypothetical protein